MANPRISTRGRSYQGRTNCWYPSKPPPNSDSENPPPKSPPRPQNPPQSQSPPPPMFSDFCFTAQNVCRARTSSIRCGLALPTPKSPPCARESLSGQRLRPEASASYGTTIALQVNMGVFRAVSFFGEASPTKIDHTQKIGYPLIPTSLEDLGVVLGGHPF